ncbi:MAG: hypothetical protein IIA05_08590, partial [Proteobacteria bacterium]|nr:hypothetical protein [Pseudomonadota bacterium]
CTGKLEPHERDKFIDDQRAGLDERFADAKEKAEKRASYSIAKWGKIIAQAGGQVSHEVALGVFPDPPAKEKKISLSYALSADNAQEVENAKFGFSFREKWWASPTTNSKFSTALAVDLSWKEVDTNAASTVTRAADFLPLSFSIAPIEPLKISASAGIAYLETEELDIVSGIKDSRDDVAHVYKIGVSYQTSMPCLALGVEYKIRTDKVFSERLSYEWLPTMTFDLLKTCSLNK